MKDTLIDSVITFFTHFYVTGLKWGTWIGILFWAIVLVVLPPIFVVGLPYSMEYFPYIKMELLWVGVFALCYRYFNDNLQSAKRHLAVVVSGVTSVWYVKYFLTYFGDIFEDEHWSFKIFILLSFFMADIGFIAMKDKTKFYDKIVLGIGTAMVLAMTVVLFY